MTSLFPFVLVSELFPWKSLSGHAVVSALLLLSSHIRDKTQLGKKTLDIDEELTLNPVLFLLQLQGLV